MISTDKTTKTDYFPGNSEMALLMREQAWAATPLGPVEKWPQTLHSALAICLEANTPIAIYWGSDHIFLYNDAFKMHIKDKHPSVLGRPAREVFPKEWNTMGPNLEQVITTGKARDGKQIMSASGKHSYDQYYFKSSYNPIPVKDGCDGGVFCILSETNTPAPDLAINNRKNDFREMIDALPAAIYTTDAEGRLTHFNPAAVKFSGRVPELGTDHWCVTWKLYYPDGKPMRHDECPMAVAIKEGRSISGVEAIAERPDGKRIWFAPYPSPLHDDEGNIIGGINMLVDITERKEAEATQRLLIGELDHRVKNTLATIQSIASHTLQQTTDPSDFVDNFNGRIFALARAHSLLTKSSWGGSYLDDILKEQLTFQKLTERYDYCGPKTFLSPKTSLHLGLVLHELGTNARKYGSLSSPKGRLIVKWNVESTDKGSVIKLNWTEENGPRVKSPKKSGFGRILIEQSLRSVGGESVLLFEPLGLRCDITLPFDSLGKDDKDDDQ